MRSVDAIVIHCSASPNGKPVTAADIDRWHAARGFKRKPSFLALRQAHLPHIGYHFVIPIEGVITNGRHLGEVGAHVAGSNARSIGVCMVGTDRFNELQWNALALLVRGLQNKWPDARVLGHRVLNPDKACPGFDVAAWLDGGMAPLSKHVLNMRPAAPNPSPQPSPTRGEGVNGRR